MARDQNTGGDNADPRISIAAARKMLGMIGGNYDDSEVAEILHCLYSIAEEAYEQYQPDEISPDDIQE